MYYDLDENIRHFYAKYPFPRIVQDKVSSMGKRVSLPYIMVVVGMIANQKDIQVYV